MSGDEDIIDLIYGAALDPTSGRPSWNASRIGSAAKARLSPGSA